MAYRQMLRRPASLAQRWNWPSLSHIVHNGNGSSEDSELSGTRSCRPKYRQVHQGSNMGGAGGIGAPFGQSKCFPAFVFPVGVKCMSSTIGDGSDDINWAGDAAELLTERTVEVVTSHAPTVNEVIVAASDSAFPSAALQYLIDGVQTFTGLNWWAAIAITTILIQGAALPYHIHLYKEAYRIRFDKQRLLALKQELHSMRTEFKTKDEVKLAAFYILFGDLIWNGILLQGSIITTFYFAISNMAEKVPSFKNGGVSWFTDLTTPDSFYILPVLASLMYLLNFEAFCCYWITTSLFRFSCGVALKQPEVRKVLGLPALTRPRTSTSQSGQSQSQPPSV